MSERFVDKYRNESARLKGYDYSSPGAYFITICTKIRKHYFGNNYKSGSLGTIINQLKRVCTIYVRENKIDFNWQTRFHDHISRNNDEFIIIKNYITNNPINWNKDVENR